MSIVIGRLSVTEVTLDSAVRTGAGRLVRADVRVTANDGPSPTVELEFLGSANEWRVGDEIDFNFQKASEPAGDAS